MKLIEAASDESETIRSPDEILEECTTPRPAARDDVMYAALGVASIQLSAADLEPALEKPPVHPFQHHVVGRRGLPHPHCPL